MTIRLHSPVVTIERHRMREMFAEAKALALWRAGNDTVAIAEALNATEASVCRVIAADQDRRHALHKRGAPRA